MKVRLLYIALSSYESFSKGQSPSEALRRISKNKDIVIQKAAKGNNIEILNITSYISATEKILDNDIDFFDFDIVALANLKKIILVSSY